MSCELHIKKKQIRHLILTVAMEENDQGRVGVDFSQGGE